MFAAKCASPRTGIDPGTNRPYPDTQGTLDDEKSWLRSWTDELYLWYREVPSVNPGDYATAVTYFEALKTPAITASGKPKDQFHFTYATADWEALSQSGVQAGYGLQWALLAARPPRKLVVADVDPGTPAAAANVARGAEVLTIDGVDVQNGSDVRTLNEGLYPSALNESHTFVLRDLGAATARTVVLTSAKVMSVPVKNVKVLSTATGSLGYMTFNDHLATAEAALIAAIGQLRTAGVTDLVIDMRYNGGGYLDIASELAFMIAGRARTAGKTFERTEFNDKYPTRDPVTGEVLAPMPFWDKSLGFTAPNGAPLPSLGLGRVFVLTGLDTCSASESVMNSLRGIDVDVIQIGSTTCGKPYGFYPQDNCGTTYFSIEFQGVNDKGFGDYADGFTPGGTGPTGLPGCQVADDFTHALGDPGEGRLAAALAYRATSTCPAAALGAKPSLSAIDGKLVKSPWRENRWRRAPGSALPGGGERSPQREP
ncbi:MAG TPA: S41 family peptidase [Haliangiales bacterium]|nr:S41 family peptidase [Haliangiales bacterium]